MRHWIDRSLVPFAVAWIASLAALFIWQIVGEPSYAAFLCPFIFLMLLLTSRFALNVYGGYCEAELKERARCRQCLHCGYRLRGNTSGVCPECGNEIRNDD